MKGTITSPQNPIITHIKSLHNKKKRDKLEQLFIEGYRIVKDALDSNAKFEFIVISNGEHKENLNKLVEFIKQKNINIYKVSEKLFKEISDTKTPQGILAVVRKPNYNLNQIIDAGDSFLVLLDNIQDPGNMGTIIRTADAAGVTGVIVSKGCVDIYNPKVLRSTMGSIFHIPVIKEDNLEKLIDYLKNKKFNVYAAQPYKAASYFDVNIKSNTAVVIGNEANGVSKDILKKCELIEIPMFGKAESLNASVSAALIMYEHVRQKLENK